MVMKIPISSSGIVISELPVASRYENGWYALNSCLRLLILPFISIPCETKTRFLCRGAPLCGGPLSCRYGSFAGLCGAERRDLHEPRHAMHRPGRQGLRRWSHFCPGRLREGARCRDALYQGALRVKWLGSVWTRKWVMMAWHVKTQKKKKKTLKTTTIYKEKNANSKIVHEKHLCFDSTVHKSICIVHTHPFTSSS